MTKTDIEWADDVWNVTRGCSRVSPGCEKCYAERLAGRFAGPGMPYEGLVKKTKQGWRWTGKMRLVRYKLMEPLHWRQPRKVFVNSMSDLFHEGLSDGDLDEVFAVMLISCLHETRGGHTFQILTKRAHRMRAYMRAATAERIARAGGQLMEDGDVWSDVLYEYVSSHGIVHDLIWLGVSAEDQKRADERIPVLQATPAAVRFISYEPTLGPLSLDRFVGLEPGNRWQPCLCAEIDPADRPCLTCESRRSLGAQSGLRWLIAGSESGPGARPAELGWYKDVRDQCAAAGIAFFMKQHVAAGKKISLPLLDGRQHAAFPEARS
jgi:protein gp37